MFEWSDLLDIAEELVQRSGNEAAERSAISRAYYAAFGAAREYLDHAGIRAPRSSYAHTAVWDRFHEIPDTTHRRIANSGRRLRAQRRHADYEKIYLDLTENAEKAVDLARQLLTDLEQLRR